MSRNPSLIKSRSASFGGAPVCRLRPCQSWWTINFVIEQDTAGLGGRDAIEDCRIAYHNLSKIPAETNAPIML